MTKIGLIRHGSTPWNKEKRAQGKSDIPLNQEGISDAEKLAERLHTEEWEVLYTSPLKRAAQTAQIISNRLGLEISYDIRLQEVDGGLIEGTTEEERIEKWGSGWRELDLGIEKKERIKERGMSVINELVKKNTGKNILVVSHGALISHLVSELDPVKIRKEHMKNTSITEVTLEQGQWSCELFNCTKHLEI
ncbi:histidine phosphatase family protein [Halobacillus halophilus]|uniref:Phosphoglycerate mutase family protein n=1 Tax=Halobacillus halophilus (strain ATCC 35676 / DSM 2266 / JCM 20832 / KCTC 3685 / LMG 17431 / NBRC 102448 / NCIMB 2269) TaxID=866895 RepID=I0JQ97_HALH3|nr:histidine phosphatase family protein [Halobacillus halophilus]ASF40334.1 histidine phosphatase family protein [Halobacillus halophilus]CCG46317.1 phosphoglycerate mutase family protein [Halobacillus halophilus DSM 2266]